MSIVGSGFPDLLNPGGEAPDAVGVVVMPFITGSGQVCVLSDAYKYDGENMAGAIYYMADDGTNMRIKVSGLEFDTAKEYAELWLVLTDGDGAGTWYEINRVDGVNIYIAGMTVAEFAGAVGDNISIGEIWSYRDFAEVRPEGSIKFTAASIDHDGADGADTASEKSELYLSTFAQGMRPEVPLPFHARSQVDESATPVSSKIKRLDHKRTSQGRIRLEARVRNARIAIRKVLLIAKEWTR